MRQLTMGLTKIDVVKGITVFLVGQEVAE